MTGITLNRNGFVSMVTAMVGTGARDSVSRGGSGGLDVEVYATTVGGSTVTISASTVDGAHHAMFQNVPVANIQTAAGRVYDSVTAQARRG